ncbi:MAG: insulinase family protein [Desulfobacterales bacterium]|jgi:zinc protease|nr:insulinase family protein [Desulfobacterales bacterium]
MMMTAFFSKKTGYRTIWLIFIGAAALVLSAGGWLAADAKAPPAWPHENSDLTADPAVTYARLPNGFGYVLMKNREPIDRVSMHLVVRVGSLHESDAQQGVAHYLEHMQFNGSTHFNPGELVKYFQTIGMQFGPDANAHTGFDETVYDVVLPVGDSKHLAEGLRVLRDYADGALLLTEEIDRERGIILAEKRSRDSADYRTFVKVLGFEFPETRLPDRLPIGKESVIKTVDQNLLRSFYDGWYRPEKMFLVMVGDFDKPTAVNFIRARFSDLKARASELPDPDIGVIRHQGEKAFYHHEVEAGNTSVSIEVIRKVEKTPDTLAFQKEEYAGKIANQVIQNRLSELVRTPGTPFTSARIHSGRFMGEVESAEISATCAPENWEASLSKIEQVLRAAIEHGFTVSEVARVKKDFLANLNNAVKQAATRQSRVLAQKIIQAATDDRVFMSPQQAQQLFVPYIESLGPGAVHAALKRIWAPGHRLFIVTGNAVIDAKSRSPEEEILSVVQKSKGVPVIKPAEAAQIQFPYLKAPLDTGEIVKQEKISDLGILQIEFENAVRLNVMKTDFEAGKIRMDLVFGEGRSCEPKEKSGLSILAEEVMNESGLGAMDRESLERALAGKDIRLSFNIREDHFSFTGEAPSQDLPLLIQLAYAHILDPAFRPEAYALVMARFGQMYQALQKDIDGAMQLAGQRFLAGDDSRFGLPSRKNFEALSLADVQAWIEKPLREAPIEISLVGDFDEQKAMELAGRFFGLLERRPAPGPARPRDIPRFPEGESLTIPVSTEIQKGLIVIAYSTTDFWDIQRTRRLSVLGEIFSEKLREHIREKLGVSYSPYAYNRPSRAYPGYGLFQAVSYIEPKMAQQVADEVKKIGEQIAGGGVTADELSRALEPIITSIKEMRRTNAYWLRNVLVGSAGHPEQIAWSRSILSDYAAITAEDIITLAKRYLIPEKAAQIVVHPLKSDGKTD